MDFFLLRHCEKVSVLGDILSEVGKQRADYMAKVIRSMYEQCFNRRVETIYYRKPELRENGYGLQCQQTAAIFAKELDVRMVGFTVDEWEKEKDGNGLMIMNHESMSYLIQKYFQKPQDHFPFFWAEGNFCTVLVIHKNTYHFAQPIYFFETDVRFFEYFQKKTYPFLQGMISSSFHFPTITVKLFNYMLYRMPQLQNKIHVFGGWIRQMIHPMTDPQIHDIDVRIMNHDPWDPFLREDVTVILKEFSDIYGTVMHTTCNPQNQLCVWHVSHSNSCKMDFHIQQYYYYHNEDGVSPFSRTPPPHSPIEFFPFLHREKDFQSWDPMISEPGVWKSENENGIYCHVYWNVRNQSWIPISLVKRESSPMKTIFLKRFPESHPRIEQSDFRCNSGYCVYPDPKIHFVSPEGKEDVVNFRLYPSRWNMLSDPTSLYRWVKMMKNGYHPADSEVYEAFHAFLVKHKAERYEWGIPRIDVQWIFEKMQIVCEDSFRIQEYHNILLLGGRFRTFSEDRILKWMETILPTLSLDASIHVGVYGGVLKQVVDRLISDSPRRKLYLWDFQEQCRSCLKDLKERRIQVSYVSYEDLLERTMQLFSIRPLNQIYVFSGGNGTFFEKFYCQEMKISFVSLE